MSVVSEHEVDFQFDESRVVGMQFGRQVRIEQWKEKKEAEEFDKLLNQTARESKICKECGRPHNKKRKVIFCSLTCSYRWHNRIKNAKRVRKTTRPRYQKPARDPKRDTTQSIVNYLVENPGSLATEITAATGNLHSSTQNALTKMFAKGLVTRVREKGRFLRWTLVKQEVSEMGTKNVNPEDPIERNGPLQESFTIVHENDEVAAVAIISDLFERRRFSRSQIDRVISFFKTFEGQSSKDGHA